MISVFQTVLGGGVGGELREREMLSGHFTYAKKKKKKREREKREITSHPTPSLHNYSNVTHMG